MVMKTLQIILSFIFTTSLFANKINAQEDWPKVISASDGSVIKIYHPQPESFNGDVLKLRSAISVTEQGKSDPVFGTFWSINTVETDRDNRNVSIVSVQVPNLKFGSDMNDDRITFLRSALETEIPGLHIILPMDELESMLQSNTEEKKLSKNLNTTPPKIISTNKPSTLVLIDGMPKLKYNSDWGVDVVVNSPFTIVKNNNGSFYLYGGKHWYSAASATGPYTSVNDVPANLNKIQTAVDNANNNDPGFSKNDATTNTNAVTDIIVSTEPAELVQTNGEANLSPIEGTNLLYVTNTENDIFIDQSSQQYYVLLSGRWYKAPNLNGPWQYTASNNLPADFAKIPEGSPKDNVLASVAGTQAAKEAIMDAQIPQTAKVDRNKAAATVTYDGNPRFENIQGTSMQYGVNTQSSVIRYRNKYYVVENGVWFESYNPTGPWVVATERPEEVDIIPPSSPVYNVKYVYIYDVTPNWVYMGYTPGYLNTYIFGPTVVYGTGFYYSPWYGNYYYPRPCTWGFRMHYNPWVGWSMGFGYNYGWFNFGFGMNLWSGWGGGWWGPYAYHPPYRWYGAGYRNYGYYGNRGFAMGNSVRNNIRINNYSTNIYTRRTDVVTRNNIIINNRSNSVINNRNIINRPGNSTAVMPRMQNGSATTDQIRNRGSIITTDRQGNVFQRNPNGVIQERQGTTWRPINNNGVIQNLNQQQQQHDRGQQRFQNFQMQRGTPSTPQMSRPNSGGYRSGGNNSGGNRSGRRN
ncbi:hypothetical protein GALL_124150 [mine drainage metagenome]|uniref:Carbohydrate-binding family V/XII n=1 Tax=mine drainage metagenome TaxID=410659 RepID=A0A1J5SUT9_9ZZZZ